MQKKTKSKRPGSMKKIEKNRRKEDKKKERWYDESEISTAEKVYTFGIN